MTAFNNNKTIQHAKADVILPKFYLALNKGMDFQNIWLNIFAAWHELFNAVFQRTGYGKIKNEVYEPIRSR